MSFQITVKNCQPISQKLKPSNLYCNIQIGDNAFKTGTFKGKGDVAVWNHSFSAAAKESFLKVELWEKGFFQNTIHGDYIINISKYYSIPGMPHDQCIVISKESKAIAQINIGIKYIRDGYGVSNPVLSVETYKQEEKQPAKLHLQPAKNYEKEPAKPIRPTRFNDSAYDMPVPFTSTATNNIEKKPHKDKSISQSPVPFGVGGAGKQQNQHNHMILPQPSQQNIQKQRKQSNSIPVSPYQHKISEQQQHRIAVLPSMPALHKESESKKQPVNQKTPHQQMPVQNQYNFAPSKHHPHHHHNRQQVMQGNQVQPTIAGHSGHVVQPMTQTPQMVGMPPIDMNNLGLLLSGEVTIGMQSPSSHSRHHYQVPNDYAYPASRGMGWY